MGPGQQADEERGRRPPESFIVLFERNCFGNIGAAQNWMILYILLQVANTYAPNMAKHLHVVVWGWVKFFRVKGSSVKNPACGAVGACVPVLHASWKSASCSNASPGEIWKGLRTPLKEFGVDITGPAISEISKSVP